MFNLPPYSVMGPKGVKATPKINPLSLKLPPRSMEFLSAVDRHRARPASASRTSGGGHALSYSGKRKKRDLKRKRKKEKKGKAQIRNKREKKEKKNTVEGNKEKF
jgi:hypothetical protein